MRRTHIEFGLTASTESRIAYLSLGLLLALGALSTFYYWKTLRAEASLSALLQDAERPVDHVRVVPDARREETRRVQLKAAQDIVDRLRTPWPSLFLALEDSVKGDVALLRIEPDAAHQEVRITANAKTIASAVAYANSLQGTGALTHTYIASQRASAADLLNPLQVVIVGRWTAAVPVRSSDRAEQGSAQILSGASKW